jgi:hypothetical protein
MSPTPLPNRTEAAEGKEPPPALSPAANGESAFSNEENVKADALSNATDRLLVTWEPNDKSNPRNWSVVFKVWCTFQLSLLPVAASLDSSIIAPGNGAIAEYTGVSSAQSF